MADMKATPSNTSFKEELEEILDGYALVIWANTGEPDDVLEKINKTALTSIINLVDKELPKPKEHNEFECKYGSYDDFHTDINCPNAKEERAFNKAIDDIRAIIRGNDD